MLSQVQGPDTTPLRQQATAIQAFVSAGNICDPPGSAHVVRYGALKLVVLFEDGTERSIRIDKREQPLGKSALIAWRKRKGAAPPPPKHPSVNDQLKELGIPLRHIRHSDGRIVIEVTKVPFCLCGPDGNQVERMVFEPMFMLRS